MSHRYVESGSGFCARCDDMPGQGEHAVSDADVATCTGCTEQIFRTNVDGHWHHARPHDRDHVAVPVEDRPRVIPGWPS